MARTPEEIVSDFKRSFRSPTPTATLSLDRPINRLPWPAASDADWRGLPSVLVSALFRHLPVPDVVRLGYLFTPRWRMIWRGNPLSLHDRQFASLPIPRSEVANAITNVLDEYLEGLEGAAAAGRVYSLRVESTEWSPEHAARWCTTLRRGGAREVVLFNRGASDQPAMLVRIPPALLQCSATLFILHLGFFTLEPGELVALTEIMDLGLHGCACRGTGIVEGACRELRVLSVHDGVMDTVVVRSPPLLWSLSMLRTVSRSLAIDDVRFLRELLPGNTAALSISRVPDLTMLSHLYLPDTTLQIDAVHIAAMPVLRMNSVRTLWLSLNYTALRGMDEHMVPRLLQLLLACFPCVEHLMIEVWLQACCNIGTSPLNFNLTIFVQRTDDVSEEEGMASQDDPHTHGHLDLFGSLYGVARRPDALTLLDFQAGKAELALIKTLLDRTQVLSTLEMVQTDRPGIRNATEEVNGALHQFALVTYNRTLRNDPCSLVRILSVRELIRE